MDTNVVNRIVKIVELKNLNQGQFADEIGIARSRMSHIFSGRNNPSLEIVQAILIRYPEFNPAWILFGSEPALLTETDLIPSEPNVSELKKIDLFNYQAKISKENDLPVMEKSPEKPIQKESPVSNPLPGKTVVAEGQKEIKEKYSGSKIRLITLFYDDNHYENFVPGQS